MHDNLFTNNQVQSSRIIYTPSAFARSNLLYLQEIGSLRAVAPHVSSRDNLTSYLFFVVEEGSGTLTYGGVTYELSAGDCVFICCKTAYAHCSTEELWSLKWCHFCGPNMPGIYGKYMVRGGRPVFHAKDPAPFLGILDELYGLASSSDYIRDMKMYDKLATLVTLLMEESWNPESKEEAAAPKRDILEIKDYIDAHYREKLTLESLAGRFFISKHYLAHCFREQCGVTVLNYIQQVRITHAKHGLRFTDDPVEVVAMECGIENANYFSRIFKKVEGTSPQEYRKSWQAGS